MKTNRLAVLVATWFGCGYSPVAPGTAGSLAALAIGIGLHEWLGWSGWNFLLLAAMVSPVAVWAAGETARVKQIKDPSIVVIDEVLGQWITMAGAGELNWTTYLAALALFRLFDVWKPAPVRQLEALPGGVGINADDVMAGVYGAAVLWVLGHFSML
jgi:phosphatidylglycerophosphatase A